MAEGKGKGKREKRKEKKRGKGDFFDFKKRVGSHWKDSLIFPIFSDRLDTLARPGRLFLFSVVRLMFYTEVHCCTAVHGLAGLRHALISIFAR